MTYYVKKLILISFWVSLLFTQTYGQICLTSDTLLILDDANRVIQKICNKQTAEIIEYPKSVPTVVTDIQASFSFLKKNPSTYQFISGDTVLIEVQPFRNNKIQEVYLTNSEGGIVVAGSKISVKTPFNKRITIKENGAYMLHIKDRNILRKRANIRIVRYPKVDPIRYKIVQDTVFNETADSIVVSEINQRDTVFYQITDQTATLFCKRDIEHNSNTSIPVFLPQKMLDSIQHLVYWIGLSAEDTLQYQFLEQQLQHPSFKGLITSPSVASYAIDKSVQLPAAYNPNVDYYFTDLTNKNLLLRKRQVRQVLVGSVTEPLPNFGIIEIRKLERLPLTKIDDVLYYSFFLSLRNNSTVNRYPVQLKIIAYGTHKKYITKKIKTIKEIKSYKVKIKPIETPS